MKNAYEIRRSGPSEEAATDSVTLTYEQRYLRRKTVQTALGETVLVDLPETQDLGPGDRLVLSDGTEIAVVMSPEPLAEVRGQDLARLAWHIGNRHTPCQVEEERLLIQRDHVLEQMLTGLGGHVTHIEEPFHPEGGAYGHGRTHAHAHAHAADDDPNAHIPHRHG